MAWICPGELASSYKPTQPGLCGTELVPRLAGDLEGNLPCERSQAQPENGAGFQGVDGPSSSRMTVPLSFRSITC
jgi:hypothetical protein